MSVVHAQTSPDVKGKVLVTFRMTLLVTVSLQTSHKKFTIVTFYSISQMKSLFKAKLRIVITFLYLLMGKII